MTLLASAPVVSRARAESFETRLAPSPLTDGTRINITGQGQAVVQWDGNILSVSGNFSGLATSATIAALYDGAGIGIPGTKALDLSVTQATSGMIWGSLKLTRKQLAELRAGHLYVQIDSQKAPDGNLTGWLLPPHPFAGEGVPVAGAGFLPQFDVPQKSNSR
ncbi:MAG TPA: CHRD domain-containing protein [Rhizomicrobium sp.]|nr:CHRD domain-containing protein [Rhizomicrobium sp.]